MIKKLTDIFHPLKACIFITRKCNLKCDYCGVIKHPVEKELTDEEWMGVFDITEALDVGINIIFGGEPTVRPDIKQIISYLNHTKMPYAFITNSTHDVSKLDLKQLSCSIDKVTNFDNLKHNELKSSRGLKLLLKTREENGDMDLLANIGLSRGNLKDVPKMVEFFTEKNIWVITTPLHSGKEDFWLYRTDVDLPDKLTKEDREDLLEFCGDMIDLKKQGYLIHNFLPFFEKYLPKYGINSDWHCTKPSHLSINSDGGMLCCIDFAGEKVSRFTIWDLMVPHKLEKFIECYKEDVKKCPGCCWDHIIESEVMYDLDPEQGKENFQHGR